MCGICGILNFDKNLTIDEQLLLSMRDLMVHRGPDDAGIYLNGNIGMAHRRLSIIDRSGGAQPMTGSEGSTSIVYNGEIYNYLELKQRLSKEGIHFDTNSDTEVILKAYEKYGHDCLRHLRGMFAFAIWDGKRNELFAARDRLGIKPFYYTVLKEAFIFASEIKALLIHPEVESQIEPRALYNYLNLRYVPGPDTMFRGIRKLQPGHCLIVNQGQIRVRCYWDLGPNDNHQRSHAENRLEEFTDLLEDCVRTHLMSEVPLGVFLSGGIDSSIVVALMSRISEQRIKTFSVGYEQDYGVNEFQYARLVAEKYHTDHYEHPISSQDFFEFMPRLVWHMDEPISDPASVPLFFLSQFAKQHVTVVLSGEGADELLAGYYIYKKMLMIEDFRKLPASLIFSLALKVVSVFLMNEKLRDYISMAQVPLEDRYHGVSKAFKPSSLSQLLNTEINNQVGLNELYRDYYSRVKDMTPLSRMLYIDKKTWLPDDLLMKADKMTMAASQELRVPFLDHKLVEYAFSLPETDKIKRGTTKYLLRQVAKNLVPDVVVNRPKKGFPIPIQQWFRDDLNGIAHEILARPNSACRDYFRIDFIHRMLKDHQAGHVDYSENIWNLLVFEYWHSRFISQSVS
jgi:asparagine synthase (glutamine-hydrolysing)